MDYCSNIYKPQTDLYTEDLYFTTAVCALMQFDYSKNDIMEAVKHYVYTKGDTEFNARDLLEIIQERRRSYKVPIPSVKSNFTDTGSPQHESLETSSLLEENRKLEEIKLCKICLEREVNVVFLPCGHICACSNCSPAIRKCAICREFIQNAMKIQVL